MAPTDRLLPSDIPALGSLLSVALELAHHITGVVVIEDPHVLAEVDIRDPLVAADHQHVLVVDPLRRPAEVRRSRDDEWILARAGRPA